MTSTKFNLEWPISKCRSLFWGFRNRVIKTFYTHFLEDSVAVLKMTNHIIITNNRKKKQTEKCITYSPSTRVISSKFEPHQDQNKEGLNHFILSSWYTTILFRYTVGTWCLHCILLVTIKHATLFSWSHDLKITTQPYRIFQKFNNSIKIFRSLVSKNKVDI